MRYHKVVKGRFVSRPNRFVAQVEIDGVIETVHVKNTGRCRELLLPHACVWLAQHDAASRKTRFDLIAVEKEREGKAPLLINMDSQAPNAVAAEWLPVSGLFSAQARIRREVTYGSSRFDFYIEDGDRRAFLEVKGVTLEENGIAMFPDAPTERGVKHLRELMACVGDGYEGYVLFVIQMKEMRAMTANDRTHAAFGQALREAARAGVRILAVDCLVSEDGLRADTPVEVRL